MLVSTLTDRPWAQYFCCLLAGRREFVRAHPVATKRVLRAVLKAADICAVAPDRAARLMAVRGSGLNYDSTLAIIRALGYGKWRELSAEDTIRIHALRLRAAGMIKSSPQKILADGTDWRFLNELKKELKA